MGAVRMRVQTADKYITIIHTTPSGAPRKVMECYISSSLMKKETHLHLRWPEFEEIFLTFLFWAELVLYRPHEMASKHIFK